jgi:nucleoside diphosphate kinase
MRERSLVAIPYGKNVGLLIDSIIKEDFSVHALKMLKLPRNRDFIQFNDQGRSIVCMEVTGGSAVQRLVDFCARIREQHGSGAIYASTDVTRDYNAVFGAGSFSQFGNTASLSNNTLCILKPHTITAGFHGKILDKIIEHGFEISAMEMFSVERANAEEFFEVYKGVVPEYNAMVAELISGKCIALEVTKGSVQDVVEEFRTIVGPADPGIARYIRPNSLRATFGVDKVKNALHCTDLSEDGGLEAEYFFRILPSVG